MLRSHEHTVNEGESGTQAVGSMTDRTNSHRWPTLSQRVWLHLSSKCGHRVSLHVVRNGRQLYIAIRERKVPCKRGFDYDENIVTTQQRVTGFLIYKPV
jgi:hypothetical protein